jgi:hypothetical protein
MAVQVSVDPDQPERSAKRIGDAPPGSDCVTVFTTEHERQRAALDHGSRFARQVGGKTAMHREARAPAGPMRAHGSPPSGQVIALRASVDESAWEKVLGAFRTARIGCADARSGSDHDHLAKPLHRCTASFHDSHSRIREI